jgi:shikimate dehydrogenase
MIRGARRARAGGLRPSERQGDASRVQARLFGVLGDPVEHSLSPAMHNAAFARAGLPHLYLRYRVRPAQLRDALRDARKLRMAGLNLTLPLKEAVLPLLDGLTAEAAAIGAVNTLVFRERGARVLGDNTDGRGFLRALAGRVRLRGGAVALLGAGGSARAVGIALAGAGCGRIVIANRTMARGEALAERLTALGARATAVPLAAVRSGAALEGVTAVVNATSLGLGTARLPVRHAATSRRCLFVDLVYGTQATPFLSAARRAGRPTLDGAWMLLHQGALAFETWTGRPAPRTAMAAALRAAGLSLTEVDEADSVRARRPPTP